jgi:hypothetical protein
MNICLKETKVLCKELDVQELHVKNLSLCSWLSNQVEKFENCYLHNLYQSPFKIEWSINFQSMLQVDMQGPHQTLRTLQIMNTNFFL